MFAVGTLLAGKYRIDRVLGQGGMGMVVAATHIHLNQQVALKFLLPEFVHDAGVVERFAREARASAQLRGEHVCRVSDVGTLEYGAPYIVMELLTGSDLATIIAGNGALPVNVATDYILQACLGIAEAHALGIIHRDLKPANLFLTKRPDGTSLVKVLDFGIAKAQTDTNFSLTRTASVIGSPGYMSPEQLRASKNVDRRSDIWSIGVILYELVSGRTPFTGESITELAVRVSMDPTPPLTIPLPRGFDGVVVTCLEKDPNRRFQDLAGLAHALAPYGGPNARDVATGIAHVLNIAPEVAAASRPATSGAPTTLGSSAGSLSGVVRSRFPWVTLITAAVVAVAAIAVIATVHGRSNAPVAAAPAATPAPTVAPPPPVAPPDAAAMALAIDAAVPHADAAVPADAGVDAAVDAGVKSKPKKSKPQPATTQPGDFGDSRF